MRAKIDVLQSGFLDRTPPFSYLSHRLKTRLVETMRLVRFDDQQIICKQGTTASRMYFIVKGMLTLKKMKFSKCVTIIDCTIIEL